MKTNISEIDEGTGYTGYREACDIIAANTRPAGEEELSLHLCAGRIAGDNLAARVSYPSQDVSLKDGFAVKSSDTVSAVRDNPVRLKVAGSAYAGGGYIGRLEDGTAVKICSGAPIPDGADAVVSGEFCEELSTGEVSVMADAGPGRNVLRAGIEVQAGTVIVRRGERLLPGRLGLAAAAGISTINVYRRPRVAIISIGDEVVAPGEKLHTGQLYASNMVTMQAWLASSGIPCVTAVVADKEGPISQALQRHLADVDVILTSGGAWGSERDLVIGVLDNLCWKKLFHYVRMGPGKGVAFGILGNVPVFCLPGGPMSNRMAFLQLALPAILSMSGDYTHPLRIVQARLTEDVKGRHHAWTEFKDAVITRDNNGNYTAAVYSNRSGLQAIAGAGGLICIPEGRESLNCGDIVPVQLLF
ncbi:MAG TPA: molybdopterin molybdotransferase MoeA [Spirochaetota bacterium]|mgnify:CR=1 FL=1|nr:molybdopterin molybdotransferase MoeA [Spirochaetota bacterium]